jgi:hypothetical protein
MGKKSVSQKELELDISVIKETEGGNKTSEHLSEFFNSK